MDLSTHPIILYSVIVFTATLIGLLIISLVLAIVRFDAPNFYRIVKDSPELEFPSNARAQRRRFTLRILVYFDKILYLTGAFLGFLGLSVILSYTTNSFSQSFTDKINMLGTGLTIYAVGFAIVSIIGRKTPYEPPSQSNVLKGQNAQNVDSNKIEFLTIKLLALQTKLDSYDRRISMLLIITSLLLILMIFMSLYFVFK